MSSNLPKKVLVIDSDATVGSSIESGLAQYKIEVIKAQDLETTLNYFDNDDFDAIICELDFAPLHGLALAQKLRRLENIDKKSSGIIVMSGKVRPVADDLLMKELLDIEAVIKPVTAIKLLPLLSKAYGTKRKLVKFEKIRLVLLDHAKHGKVEQAVGEVKKRLEEMGQRGVVLICDLYEQSENLEEAYKFIAPIAKKNTANHLYQFTLARILKLLGRIDDAKKILEEVQKSSPKNMDRLKQLGELYVESLEADKAVDTMKNLLELNPEDDEL